VPAAWTPGAVHSVEGGRNPLPGDTFETVDVTRAYATLGVSNAATWGDLRRAYRTQLRLHHPDTGAGNARALHTVTAAYQELRARHLSRVSSAAWPAEQPESGSLVDVYA